MLHRCVIFSMASRGYTTSCSQHHRLLPPLLLAHSVRDDAVAGKSTFFSYSEEAATCKLCSTPACRTSRYVLGCRQLRAPPAAYLQRAYAAMYCAAASAAALQWSSKHIFLAALCLLASACAMLWLYGRAFEALQLSAGLRVAKALYVDKDVIPILIPVYGRPHYLRRVLSSLAAARGIEKVCRHTGVRMRGNMFHTPHRTCCARNTLTPSSHAHPA